MRETLVIVAGVIPTRFPSRNMLAPGVDGVENDMLPVVGVTVTLQNAVSESVPDVHVSVTVSFIPYIPAMFYVDLHCSEVYLFLHLVWLLSMHM